MRAFVLGMIFGIGALIAGAYFLAQRGYFDFGADRTPSSFESKVAMRAVDAWTARQAASLKNPLPSTEENIAAGATLYLNHCAGCHGVPSNPESQFQRSFYPPAPGFFRQMPDMSDGANFYVIQRGIRWTGMPAWRYTLTETQTWQLVTFFDNMHKLPPAAKKVFDISAQRTSGAK